MLLLTVAHPHLTWLSFPLQASEPVVQPAAGRCLRDPGRHGVLPARHHPATNADEGQGRRAVLDGHHHLTTPQGRHHVVTLAL